MRGIAGLVMLVLLAGAAKAEGPEPKAEAVAAKPEAKVEPQPVAIELEQKRAALEARERQLEERERRIQEQEGALDKKLKEMSQIREAVSGELEAQRKNNEERILRMVGVYETMTPKAAANVFETLDDWLAIEVLKRMDIKRVAKIMNNLEKSRSAKLSEMLTGFYNPAAERKISSQAAGQGKAAGVKDAPQSVPNPQKKGGEK